MSFLLLPAISFWAKDKPQLKKLCFAIKCINNVICTVRVSVTSAAKKKIFVDFFYPEPKIHTETITALLCFNHFRNMSFYKINFWTKSQSFTLTCYSSLNVQNNTCWIRRHPLHPIPWNATHNTLAKVMFFDTKTWDISSWIQPPAKRTIFYCISHTWTISERKLWMYLLGEILFSFETEHKTQKK